MRPAINHEVAGFLPRNAAAAVAGELLGAAASFVRGGASATQTFFRGVSEAEAADVAATGTLRNAGGATGNEGKYLTNTVEAASGWARMNGPGAQVLRITVPADATTTFTPLGRIDGIGKAWFAPLEALKNAGVSVVKEGMRAIQ